MSDRAKLTGYPDHETVRMAIAVATAARHGVTAEILGILRDRLAIADATVAALTAENQRLRETLTLGLGEQESVIAGLRAENERMRAALTEAIAHVEGKGPPSIRIQGVPRALQIPLAALDRWRAALPSSRETTDGAD